MAVLSTILVILVAWCAASVITAALYVALRHHHVRLQRAALAVPGARTGRPGHLHRPRRPHRHHLHLRRHRPGHPSGRSGWGRRVPPQDLQAG
ncbi:hypothetical protein [Streptomyces sp. NBC_01264]|uniref:hypothetical protein n=1 Tax=Streptomyces sp. NBC_01264 TaxID=2903804 RepID=UPI002251752B|nr:hypothetical protein [Streptomyces sp. NBC_01264]MCX4775673.1 hypothetical protein [Streptomyces sp. NBC_01264]